MAANEIWASPTTLTGSIGVGATIPTFQRLLDWFGVHVDGIGTTELAGAFDATRELNENVKGMIGQMIRQTYGEFIGKVAEHRERTVEQIDGVAHGRVWVGSDALDRGLVDRLGNLPRGDRVRGRARGARERQLRRRVTSSSSSDSRASRARADGEGDARGRAR